MGVGQGGLKPGEVWELHLELEGNVTPEDAAVFWGRLRELVDRYGARIRRESKIEAGKVVGMRLDGEPWRLVATRPDR